MPNKDKVDMLLLLVQNVVVFAWSSYEVLGVDLSYPPRNKTQGGQQKSM